MKLSDEGLRLIKSFEGFHAKQKDGSAKAYRCPAGVWTCGWGCTEGVTANTHWTAAEATERLAAEIAKFETAVLQHVTVPLNQNQFDALVSFAYNCGVGALKKSTLLKRVNAEKWEEAAKQFPRWNRGGGRVLGGLVSRRAREAALFLKPIEAPVEPAMPQTVEPPPTVSAPVVATGTVAAAGVGTGAVTAFGVPMPPLDTVIATAQSPLFLQIAAAAFVYLFVCHVLPRWVKS